MNIGLRDDQAGRYYPLRKPKAHIGSAEGCQFLLDHAGVAALHAELVITEVGIELPGPLLCRNQPLVWVVLTKLENSLARSNQSRFG